jgi:hypothetical protein
MSLKNTYNTKDIAKLIPKKIKQASKIEIIISLIWVLGYSDIEGNEQEDREAKKAVEYTDIPILNTTTFAYIKNQI